MDGPSTATQDVTIRFSSSTGHVDVTANRDDPVVRDLIGLLPFTTRFEEFAGREKIGDPPRRLDTAGSNGSDPEDGDLIYYEPWGNLRFYYDASGVGYDARVHHIGSFRPNDRAALAELERGPVTVSLAPQE